MRLITTNLIMYGIILACAFLICAKNCAGQTEIIAVTSNSENDTEVLKIQEVDDGKTAILLCHSNKDKEHFFLFWRLAKGDAVVGPGNTYNDLKYDYEILSGNLIIRAVSSDEEGTYDCVSRGVTTDNINIRSVRMIVKKDWEEVYEHDPGVNYFRGVVIVISLLVIAGGVYFAYRLRRRHRLHSLLEAESDEEDSAEEIFRAPGTSRGTGNIVLDKAEDPVEVPKISIDFEDILNNSHK